MALVVFVGCCAGLLLAVAGLSRWANRRYPAGVVTQGNPKPPAVAAGACMVTCVALAAAVGASETAVPTPAAAVPDIAQGGGTSLEQFAAVTALPRKEISSGFRVEEEKIQKLAERFSMKLDLSAELASDFGETIALESEQAQLRLPMIQVDALQGADKAESGDPVGLRARDQQNLPGEVLPKTPREPAQPQATGTIETKPEKKGRELLRGVDPRDAALLFIAMCLGMALKVLWDAIEAKQGKNPLPLSFWNFARPVVVAPMVFLLVWEATDAQNMSILTLCFAYQNGFTWQTLLGKSFGL